MNEKKSIGATFVAWLAWLTRWTTITLIALRAAVQSRRLRQFAKVSKGS